MNLADYIPKGKRDHFAKLAGVSNSLITKICKYGYVPTPVYALRIEIASGGQVTAADLGLSDEGQAEVGKLKRFDETAQHFNVNTTVA
jgi:DNA-binding transcriptional regulator YdaS (Cro superfamily)